MTATITSIAKKMRAREIEITAPRGQKTATVRALREAGCAVRSDGTASWDPERDRRGVPRPNQDAVIELATAGLVKLLPAGSYRDFRGEVVTGSYDPNPTGRLYPLAKKAAQALSRERLVEACHRDRGTRVGGMEKSRYGYSRYAYRVSGAEAVEEILDRVGPAGEQALADETRYFERYDREQYESRNHSGRDWRGVSRAVIASDESAAILAFIEAGSYLNKGVTWDSYDPDYNPTPPGGLHHLRISAYLVVRDATSGERHVLRIPPRFGRYKSATWRRYLDENAQGDADGLIHAAVAWTFGMRPEEYRPGAES